MSGPAKAVDWDALRNLSPRDIGDESESVPDATGDSGNVRCPVCFKRIDGGWFCSDICRAKARAERDNPPPTSRYARR